MPLREYEVLPASHAQQDVFRMYGDLRPSPDRDLVAGQVFLDVDDGRRPSVRLGAKIHKRSRCLRPPDCLIEIIFGIVHHGTQPGDLGIDAADI